MLLADVLLDSELQGRVAPSSLLICHNALDLLTGLYRTRASLGLLGTQLILRRVLPGLATVTAAFILITT